ncbi:MAG: DUF1273 domain-containing protein [Ruminococcaceae bacterium]|nr:DUF1273 domain-containing protein [Oscillospiraceae bacterium]
MQSEIKSCAFTGHRQIKKEHISLINERLGAAIEYAYSQGCKRFLSGGAVGFDTAAAREVLRFKLAHPDVSLIMLLPCVEQDRLWSDRQKDAYEYILSNSDEVRYISDSYDNICMRRRNQALAEECDIMIAYLSHSISGAGQTVRMAQKLGKSVFNLYHDIESRLKNSI